MVHDILFKFALDAFGLFGGSDLSAAKGEGREGRGRNRMRDVEEEGVRGMLGWGDC